jgi:hypothetical protein
VPAGRALRVKSLEKRLVARVWDELPVDVSVVLRDVLLSKDRRESRVGLLAQLMLRTRLELLPWPSA